MVPSFRTLTLAASLTVGVAVDESLIGLMFPKRFDSKAMEMCIGTEGGQEYCSSMDAGSRFWFIKAPISNPETTSAVSIKFGDDKGVQFVQWEHALKTVRISMSNGKVIEAFYALVAERDVEQVTKQILAKRDIITRDVEGKIPGNVNESFARNAFTEFFRDYNKGDQLKDNRELLNIVDPSLGDINIEATADLTSLEFMKMDKTEGAEIEAFSSTNAAQVAGYAVDVYGDAHSNAEVLLTDAEQEADEQRALLEENINIAIASGVSALVVIIIVVWCCCCKKGSKNKKSIEMHGGSEVPAQCILSGVEFGPADDIEAPAAVKEVLKVVEKPNRKAHALEKEVSEVAEKAPADEKEVSEVAETPDEKAPADEKEVSEVAETPDEKAPADEKEVSEVAETPDEKAPADEKEVSEVAEKPDEKEDTPEKVSEEDMQQETPEQPTPEVEGLEDSKQ